MVLTDIIETIQERINSLNEEIKYFKKSVAFAKLEAFEYAEFETKIVCMEEEIQFLNSLLKN